MFIQILQGPCSDYETLTELTHRWEAELGPGAQGWLGSTFGLTDEGHCIGVVRFTDRDAAERNSNRSEQSAWWAEAEKCFSAPVTFHNSDDVTVMLGGGSDDAGFVQVIQGGLKDADKLRAMMAHSDELHAMRPDILGGTLAICDDGTFTETVAFSDEDAARRGEAQEMPAEIASLWDDAARDVRFFDLHTPLFSSPR